MDSAQSVNQLGEDQWLVFISHAGEDTWVASRVATEIVSRGAVTFLDEAHVAVGEDFEERVLPALNRSNELLVYLTPWALKRPYVWMEIGAAWVKRIPIVCILHGITAEELQKGDVPVLMKRRNLININEIGRYFEALENRIRAYRDNSLKREKDEL